MSSFGRAPCEDTSSTKVRVRGSQQTAVEPVSPASAERRRGECGMVKDGERIWLKWILRSGDSGQSKELGRVNNNESGVSVVLAVVADI